MIFFLLVLFTVAIVTAQRNEESIVAEYKRIIQIVNEAKEKYSELPNPKKQLENLNAHSIFRLSEHLKKNYEMIRRNALAEKCRYDQCFGSDAYKNGVSKVCLYTDSRVAYEIELYDNFTECSDKYLREIISNIELVEVKMNELETSKQNLDEEYTDEENRQEMGLILEYHSQIVNDSKEALVNSVEKLKNLYVVLPQSLDSCEKYGFPKISKKLYYVASVQQCMNDFLKIKQTSSTDFPSEFTIAF